MNRLFVAYKPPHVSSNRFLTRLRWKYGKVPHAGFSGTLDPFAQGCLIVAFGQYTKLFSYLPKTPKRYRATLWLGAESDTLDIEGVTAIGDVSPVSEAAIVQAMEELSGEQMQLPPKYSALRIDGRRAYSLARAGHEFDLQKRPVTISEFKLIHYRHPLITFECEVSEGTYVRSLGLDLANKLGCTGSLSFLERLSEGRLFYENEKALDPLAFIDLPRNFYPGPAHDLYVGKRLVPSDLQIQTDGDYLVDTPEFFVILTIHEGVVKYKQGCVLKSAL